MKSRLDIIRPTGKAIDAESVASVMARLAGEGYVKRFGRASQSGNYQLVYRKPGPETEMQDIAFLNVKNGVPSVKYSPINKGKDSLRPVGSDDREEEGFEPVGSSPRQSRPWEDMGRDAADKLTVSWTTPRFASMVKKFDTEAAAQMFAASISNPEKARIVWLGGAVVYSKLQTQDSLRPVGKAKDKWGREQEQQYFKLRKELETGGMSKREAHEEAVKRIEGGKAKDELPKAPDSKTFVGKQAMVPIRRGGRGPVLGETTAERTGTPTGYVYMYWSSSLNQYVTVPNSNSDALRPVGRAVDYDLVEEDCVADINYYKEQIKTTEAQRKQRGDQETDADLHFYKEQLAIEERNLARVKRGERVVARDMLLPVGRDADPAMQMLARQRELLRKRNTLDAQFENGDVSVAVYERGLEEVERSLRILQAQMNALARDADPLPVGKEEPLPRPKTIEDLTRRLEGDKRILERRKPAKDDLTFVAGSLPDTAEARSIQKMREELLALDRKDFLSASERARMLYLEEFLRAKGRLATDALVPVGKVCDELRPVGAGR